MSSSSSSTDVVVPVPAESITANKSLFQVGEDGMIDVTPFLEHRRNVLKKNATITQFLATVQGKDAKKLVEADGCVTHKLRGANKAAGAHPYVALALARWCCPDMSAELEKMVCSQLLCGSRSQTATTSVEKQRSSTELNLVSKKLKTVTGAVEQLVQSMDQRDDALLEQIKVVVREQSLERVRKEFKDEMREMKSRIRVLEKRKRFDDSMISGLQNAENEALSELEKEQVRVTELEKEREDDHARICALESKINEIVSQKNALKEETLKRLLLAFRKSGPNIEEVISFLKTDDI